MIYFETSRLVFRDWKEEDLDEFREMNKDGEVMEFFPSILSNYETDLLYKKIQDEFKEYEYGLYAVEIRDKKEFIGFIGFHWATFHSEFTPCIEIGWRLKKEAWGKGFATEGAKVCLSYGFNCLGFNEVYSFTSKVNEKSENIMKKIGMTKSLEFKHPKIDLNSLLSEHVVYCITSLQHSNLNNS